MRVVCKSCFHCVRGKLMLMMKFSFDIHITFTNKTIIASELLFQIDYCIKMKNYYKCTNNPLPKYIEIVYCK